MTYTLSPHFRLPPKEPQLSTKATSLKITKSSYNNNKTLRELSLQFSAVRRLQQEHDFVAAVSSRAILFCEWENACKGCGLPTGGMSLNNLCCLFHNMKETEMVSISQQIFNELNKNPNFKLLFYLQDHGETKAYSLRKEFGWTIGKVHSTVNSLLKAKSIEVRQELVNGRMCRFIKLKQEEAK